MDLNNFNSYNNRKINDNKIYTDYINETKQYYPLLHAERKDEISFGNSVNEEVKKLKNDLDKTKEQQGIIGKIWDGFKNITHIGAGSKKVEKALEELQQGKISEEEVQKKLENYKEGQKVCIDVFSDILSSIVAVGAFAAAVPTGGMSLAMGLSLSTLLGGGIKAGIKGIDSKINNREYQKENFLYDVVTGGVNGLLAPVTNGLGSSLTKTIGCKLGLEVTGDIVSAGTKSTLKNLIVNQSIDVAGGTMKKRALAIGAGMAVDGALGGTADNVTRAALEGKDTEGIKKSAVEGFFGGLIMSPIIGGGMRLAGKLGKNLGDKISNKKSTNANTKKGTINKNTKNKTNKKQKTNIEDLPNSKASERLIFNRTNQTTDISDTQLEKPIKPSAIEEVEDLTKKVETFIEDSSNEPSFKATSNEAAQTAEKVKSSTIENSETATLVQENSVIRNIKDSIKNIPSEEEDKINFLINLFQTDLETGEQIGSGIKRQSFDFERIEALSQYDSDDLAVAIEHFIEMAKIRKRNTLYLPYTIEDPDVYRNIKKRNIYQIVRKRQELCPNESFFPLNMEWMGKLSDNDYKKAVNLIEKIGINNPKIQLNNIVGFAVETEQNTIDYMLKNDLFNPDIMGEFDNLDSILSNVKGCQRSILEKIHKRGLLQQIPERDNNIISFENAKWLAEKISDEEWEKTIKRGLLSLKTPTGLFYTESNIVKLTELSDAEFAQLQARNLFNLAYKNGNIITLAKTDEKTWQTLVKRGVDLNEIDLRHPKKLAEFLSISDEKWQIAQKRGLSFKEMSDYDLLELSEESWNNLIKRNLNEMDKYGYDTKYDVESQIRMAKLTDSEFQNAKSRQLIKEKHSYNNPAFNEEAEFLAKCSDEEYLLFLNRGIDKIKTSVENKKLLLSFTDEQYERVQKGILPKTKKYIKKPNQYGSKPDDIPDCFKIALLDEEEYQNALLFVGKEYLGTKQFDADEITKILQLAPEKRERLLNILNSTPQKEKFDKEALFKLTEFEETEYYKIISSLDYLTVSQAENYVKNSSIIEICNSDLFETNKNPIKKVNNSELSSEAKKELVDRLLGFIDNDYSQLNLREKMKKLKILQEAQNSKIFENEPNNYLNLENEITKIQDSINHIITPTPVSKPDSIRMFKNFFANNNPLLDELLSKSNIEKYGKNGLPLSYSRTSFLEDLNRILKEVSPEEETTILRKLGISIIKNEDRIVGYDGIIDLGKLSKAGNEAKVLSIAQKFIKENRIETDDEALNEVLNSLIKGMPEFVNIIGKQQHKSHDYALDIHTLAVLKNAMSNPKYKELSNTDKFCLKFATLLHDISKADSIKDDGHAELCSLYAKDILGKDVMQIPPEIKDRIFELIKNHHWLTDFSQENKSAEELAVLFRRTNDLKVAQIMSEADLKSVNANDKFYNLHAEMLSDEIQEPLVDAIKKINADGNIFLTNRIIDSKKIPTMSRNGKNYKVVDFTKLSDDADLSQFGFEPGTTKRNLRVLIHTVSEEKLNNLKNVIHLSDPNYQGFLCASFISPKNNLTYGGNQFGVSIHSEAANIGNASVKNQGSGGGKNFARFSAVLTGKDKTSQYRTLIPDAIKSTLNLSDKEYAELYSKIQGYKYSSQFDNIGEIKINDRRFSGTEIKEAINQANDLILKKDYNYSGHSEVNLYTPKTDAVIAKVDNFDEIPQELLDIAEENNLPIYIFGE